MAKLSSKYKTGEVAEALVKEYFLSHTPNECCATGLIKFLDENKFVISPRPYARPARRGIGNTKPPKYTGPDWLGKSHTQRLIGG